MCVLSTCPATGVAAGLATPPPPANCCAATCCAVVCMCVGELGLDIGWVVCLFTLSISRRSRRASAYG